MAKLSIQCPDQPERIVPVRDAVVTIGRGDDCDLTVADTTLSRIHCRLEKEGAAYRVVDLKSANGTRVNGNAITTPCELMTGDLIGIGRTRILYVADTREDKEDDGIDAGQTISLDAVDDGIAAEVPKAGAAPRYALQYRKGEARRVMRLGKEAVSIGRHASCSLVFDDKSVSSCHARIERRGDQYVVFDLGSTNGVKVNGRKVESETLRPGTRIRIGNITLGFKEIVPRPSGEASAPPIAAVPEAAPPPAPTPAEPIAEASPASEAPDAPQPASTDDLPVDTSETVDAPNTTLWVIRILAALLLLAALVIFLWPKNTPPPTTPTSNDAASGAQAGTN